MGSGELIAARKGVLLATGGYGADPQMSWEFEQLPGFAQEGSGLIPQSLTGDGLVLGAEIGGILHKVENSLRVMLSTRSRRTYRAAHRRVSMLASSNYAARIHSW